MDVNGGIRGRLEKQSKLSLPKKTAQNMKSSVEESVNGLKVIVEGDSKRIPLGNRDLLENTNATTNSVSSILKRVRRYHGKENEIPESMTSRSLVVGQANVNSPVQKRVRILTPIEETMTHKSLNRISTPYHNKGVLLSKENVSLNSTSEILHDVGTEGHKSLEFDTTVSKSEKCPQNDGYLIEYGGDNEDCGIQRNRRRNIKDFEHWLLIRFQPKVLTDVIKSLSPTQRKWVKNTGFGSLLSFRMNEYPQALAYHLVLNFKRHLSSVCYDNITIPIADDDVHEILGLPKGNNRLVFIRSTHTEDLWRAQFVSPERLGWKITANMVCEAIKRSTLADRLFKLNFLVLMTNILIEGPSNPYVKQTMLSFSGDIDQCNQYNWCQYLISQLRIASESWNENPVNKRFTGSVPFLVFLYMDRVVKGKRQVRRKKPTYVGWSDTLILDRQISDISNNTLFKGRIALPLRYKDSDDESSYENCTWNKNEENDSDGEEVDGKCSNDLSKLSLTIKKVSDDVLESDLKKDDISTRGKMKYQCTEPEVPRYVIDQLKVSLDGYENFQRKCMMYLLSAKEIFKNNSLVTSLESKFIGLIQKSNEFVSNELNGQSRSDKQGNGKSPFQNLFFENRLSVEKNDALEHDDEMCFSEHDWNVIDSLSVPRENADLKSSTLFNSMESQSKSLTLTSPSCASAFKTPADKTVFKVHLDATIPSFNLCSENENDGKVIAGGLLGRPVRERKIADIKKSPFVDRFTSIHGKSYKKEETDLWNWIHADDRHLNRILFSWKNITCYKADFQSMMDGEMVMTSAIDVWSCFLNSQEYLRSPTSPRRLFCYTETTIGTLNAYNEKTIENKFHIFYSNMQHIETTYDIMLKDIDLVFFPIHHVNHYYVVCYNLKNPSIEILDNRHSEKSVKILYGHQLMVLQKHFMAYLRKRNYRKINELENIEPQRLVMHWQTKNNGVDCGIFAMRHMETYLGGGTRTWNSKFAVESHTQRNQISRLRLLFTYRMISSDINMFYGVILDEIKDPKLLPKEAGSPEQQRGQSKN